MWDRIDSKWVLLENHTSVPEVLARGTQPATTYKVDQQGTECPPTRVYSGNLIQHIVLHGMWTGTLDSNVREHMLSTTLELGAVPNRNRSNNEHDSTRHCWTSSDFRGDPCGISKIARYCYVSYLPYFVYPRRYPPAPSPPTQHYVGMGGLFSVGVF